MSTTNNLQKIDHIIVVMLENRSFDNLLGWLYEGKQTPDGQPFEGLTPDLWNPLNNVDTDGNPFIEKVPVRKNGDPIRNPGRKTRYPKENFCLPFPDPGEGFRTTNHQLFSYYIVDNDYPPIPTNMGFVNDYVNAMLYGTYGFGDAPTDPRAIMTCYKPEQVPVLSELARQFAVCDHWHASVPSQTLPNRDFIHAATSCGHVNNGPDAFCDAPTIYGRLQAAIDNGANLTWGVFGNNLLTEDRNKPGAEKDNDHYSLTRLILTELHDNNFHDNFQTIEDFYALVDTGNTPNYAFLEPDYHGPTQSDQHPPADIRAGDQFLADIYNHLVNSPQWEKTLLVITYDEHGGCYDHVAPPGHAANPDPQNRPGQDGFRFNRFGVRVPTVLVSPHIPQGIVCRPPSKYKGELADTPFDHTSVIASLCRRFNLPHLTARDAAAPDLGLALTLDQPRQDKPTVRPLEWSHNPAFANHVNDLQRVMEQAVSQLTSRRRPKNTPVMAFVYQAFRDYFSKE